MVSDPDGREGNAGQGTEPTQGGDSDQDDSDTQPDTDEDGDVDVATATRISLPGYGASPDLLAALVARYVVAASIHYAVDTPRLVSPRFAVVVGRYCAGYPTCKH